MERWVKRLIARFLSTVLIAVSCIGGVQPGTAVFAAGTAEGLYLPNALSMNCGEKYAATVYYGEDIESGGNLTWRVINYNGNDPRVLSYPYGEDNLTLFAGDIMGESIFSESSNEYGTSDLKTAVDLIYTSDRFSEKERRAIKQRELYAGENEGYYTDCIKGAELTGDDAPYLWPLSGKEAHTIYNQVRGTDDNYLKATASWFTRSPAKANLSVIDVDRENGVVHPGDDPSSNGNCKYSRGVRPAFNIGLSSVLFTSLVSGTAFKSGASYKLTLKDEDLGATPGTVSVNGNTVTVPYSDVKGNPTQLSVVIVEGTWEANGWRIRDENHVFTPEYFGKLNIDGNIGTEGSGTFTLPYNHLLLNSDYNVYLLAEETHIGEKTDYAGIPKKITIDNKIMQTPVFKESSVTLKVGKTITNELTGASSTVTYKSSNENVATVSNNGMVTAVDQGEAIITATAAEDGDYFSADASFKVTVVEGEEENQNPDTPAKVPVTEEEKQNSDTPAKVPVTSPGEQYAASGDNFAPITSSGKINDQVLDFSKVTGSDVNPSELKMTAINGSKFTTKEKLKSRDSVKTTGGVKVKVNKKTLIPKITCKKSGTATFTMADETTFTVTFTVEKPKAQASAKNMKKEDGKTVVRTVKDLFGTDIDAGELTVLKQKHSQARVSDNNLYIDPKEKDSIKVQYKYLNKKYKMTIKVK